MDGTGAEILHRFGSTPGDGTPPTGGLMEGSDGRLYGVCARGGAGNAGIVFGLDRTGENYRILRTFLGALSMDGTEPVNGLVEASDGLLYGVTQNGGDRSDPKNPSAGTLYRLAKDGTGYEVLVDFHFRPSIGVYPRGVTEGQDGRLYGVCGMAGRLGGGTVWRVQKDGSGFELLHEFTLNKTDGFDPEGRLLALPDGRFYGTTIGNNGQIVFRIGADGTAYEVLRTLQETEARWVFWQLTAGLDGFLYGVAEYGGASGVGSVFRMRSDGGEFQVVKSFGSTPNEGSVPDGRLACASDGSLYGVAAFGGSAPGLQGNGALFALTFAVPVKLACRLGNGGQLLITGVGDPGRTYHLQTSPTAEGVWQEAAQTVAAADGTFSFAAPWAKVPAMRFYRTKRE
jgi:uncharacterized repeat protein (TIGR03803 family)